MSSLDTGGGPLACLGILLAGAGGGHTDLFTVLRSTFDADLRQFYRHCRAEVWAICASSGVDARRTHHRCGDANANAMRGVVRATKAGPCHLELPSSVIYQQRLCQHAVRAR